jgi:hypothetical protein
LLFYLHLLQFLLFLLKMLLGV